MSDPLASEPTTHTPATAGEAAFALADDGLSRSDVLELLNAALARAVPPWTETPPTVEGWYWCECPWKEVSIVRAEKWPSSPETLYVSATDVRLHPAGTRWSGPIPRPG